MQILKFLLIPLGFITIFSFVTTPNIEVVQNFEAPKYLGQWYEIARLDYKWEKNLNNVTAVYGLSKNGTISVHNKGYDTETGKWKEATGKAKFVRAENEGKLKVSFFGPFYSRYNVVAIDPGYQYALVIGSGPEYMWILSREPKIPEQVKQQYLAKAKELGVQTENLVWVDHNQQK